jgi:hypothetical protein
LNAAPEAPPEDALLGELAELAEDPELADPEAELADDPELTELAEDPEPDAPALALPPLLPQAAVTIATVAAIAATAVHLP